MRSLVFASVSALTLIGTAGSAVAQSTCSNADITGRWMFEVTAHATTTDVYTFICPVVIRPNRTMDPATCTQIDGTDAAEEGNLTIPGPFTVSSNCIVRSLGGISLRRNIPGGGSVTFLPDTFTGWLSADKGAMTAVLAGSVKRAKISAYRR